MLVNHYLGKYNLYVREVGATEPCDFCSNDAQFAELRYRLVKEGLTDKYEFYFDFDKESIITLDKEGVLSIWPYLPDDHPTTQELGVNITAWSEPHEFLLKLLQYNEENKNKID